MSTYNCLCGKQFTNPQSFNGHKAHCKVHLVSTGKLEQRVELNKRANKACSEAFARRRLEKEQNWTNEQHRCERCGVIMTVKWGTGRFCSSSCANSHPCAEETKLKIGNTTRNTLLKRNAQKLAHKEAEYLENPNFCAICDTVLSYDKRQNRTCGNPKCVNELLRSLQLEKVAAGTHQGWLRRNVLSYPEQFWKQVLDNNNISYEHDYAISTGKTHYLLDFFIDGYIDLEIDGGQHELPEAIEHDKKRNEYVLSQGWHVYRIKWISPRGDKQAVIKQIDEFIDWYKSQTPDPESPQFILR